MKKFGEFRRFLIEDEERIPFPLSKHCEGSPGFSDMCSIVRESQKKSRPKTKTVKISKLKASQDWINRDEGGKQPFEIDDKPIVYLRDGVHIILDGHHRLSSKKEAGETEAEVYLYEDV